MASPLIAHAAEFDARDEQAARRRLPPSLIAVLRRHGASRF
jgi:hypothetical protein